MQLLTKYSVKTAHLSETSSPYEELKSLDSLYFSPAWNPNQWEVLKFSKNRRIRVFWLLDELSCCVGYILGEENQLEEAFEIFKVIIEPKSRGKKLAKYLLRYSERYILKHGMRRVILQVETSNMPALKLYQNMDYEELRNLRSYYGQGRDAIELTNQLLSP